MTRRGSILLCLALMGVALLLFWGRAIVDARSELAQARAFQERGQLHDAIAHYRRSVRSYAPANPYSERAIEALIALALRLETDDPHMAALAWVSARESLVAIEWLRKPYPEARAQLQGSASAFDPAIDQSAPSAAAAWLVLLGMIFWIGGGFRAAARGDSKRWRAARELWPLALGVGLTALGLWL